MAETHMRAPNRPLCLDELDQPYFRRLAAEMEDMLAHHRSLYLHPSKRWEYGWALQRVELDERQNILDAGCGFSIFPAYLAARGYDVTACDLTVPDDEHVPEVRYVHGDIRDLPFGDDSFDVIFCVSVIEHLELSDIPQALSELRRVLKPGGALLMTTDFYEDSNASLWHISYGRTFRVDWNVFDAATLRSHILNAPGFAVDGEIDMSVDWERTRENMRAFHGYAYTSIGVKLVKSGPNHTGCIETRPREATVESGCQETVGLAFDK